MNKIDFYEVIDKKGRWMGSYSPELDEISSMPAFNMARINASSHDGEIYAVKTQDGEQKRTKIWPKKS